MATSVPVTISAWKWPGLRPRLSNQLAIPGPDWIAFTCRQPWAKIMIAIHTRASSSAKLAASLSKYMSPSSQDQAVCRVSAWGRTLPRDVTQPRHQSRLGEHADRPLFVGVDHQGLTRLPPDDERHDAVLAGGSGPHHALVAVDGQHATTLTRGCDSYAGSL